MPSTWSLRTERIPPLGFGITPPLAEDLFELGIDVITTGNHIWDKREIIDYFQSADGNPHSPARSACCAPPTTRRTSRLGRV